jgi:hypothetical protein
LILRSAVAETVVNAVAVLLVGLGSASLAVTLALFVSVAEKFGAFAVIVMAGAAPTASEANVHVTVPADCAQVQPVPLALTKVTSDGRVSVTVTFVAGSGPALFTFRV